MTTRTKAIASLLAVFLLGGLAGALVVGLVVRGRVREAQVMRDRDGFRAYFSERLSLTEGQRDSLQSVLDQTHEELEALRIASAEEYQSLLDSFEQRAKPVLNAEQLTKLQQIEGEMKGRLPRGKRPPWSNEPSRSRHVRPPGSAPVPPSAPNLSPPAAPSSPPSDTPSRATASTKGVTPPPAVVKQEDTSLETAEMKAGDTNGVADNVDNAMAIRGPLIKKIAARLNLSDDQTRQVQAIVADTRATIKEQLAGKRGLPQLQIEVLRRNINVMSQRIDVILDETQRAEFERVKQEVITHFVKKALKGQRGRGRRGHQQLNQPSN